ncbi:NfeD family protein [Ilumatobacter sp.]|uniref:NfeD family protein n=1 Tax=Ilumatobacter sp. TaxID=1967498 RepID=UPI003C464EB7
MAAVLDLGIDLDAWPWIWLVVAALFALVELTALAGTFVLLPFAVSAFVASIAGFYDASVEVQWSIFVVLGAVLWYLAWRYLRSFVNDNAMPEGVGADRLVGMTAIVTADIDPNDTERHGRVMVVGEPWGALADPMHTVRKGSKVRIIAMEGTRVVVEPLVVEPPVEPPTAPPTAPGPPPNPPFSPPTRTPEES